MVIPVTTLLSQKNCNLGKPRLAKFYLSSMKSFPYLRQQFSVINKEIKTETNKANWEKVNEKYHFLRLKESLQKVDVMMCRCESSHSKYFTVSLANTFFLNFFVLLFSCSHHTLYTHPLQRYDHLQLMKLRQHCQPSKYHTLSAITIFFNRLEITQRGFVSH